MPQIIIEQPGVPTRTVPVSGRETRFGRAEDNDVVLVADEVSRHHARLLQRGTENILLDLKSMNGTYVNRQRVVERVLSHMDEIWFGSKCRIVFRDDTELGKAGRAATPATSDSQLISTMKQIRDEMDQVSSTMTLLGKRSQPKPGTTAAPVVEETVAGTADGQDLVQLGRAFRRLESMHRASQAMAGNFDLETRLSQVMDIVLEVMEADEGFVMLREEGTEDLTVVVARTVDAELDASSPSMGIAGRAAIDGEPVLMADREADADFGSRDSIILHRIKSAMCVPLRVEERLLGSIYVDSRSGKQRFSEEDLELFASLASQAAMAVDNVRLHNRVVAEEKKRQSLGRFLSPSIVDKILTDDSTLSLGGQKARVTTMFCDIRGSSKLAEQLAAGQLVDLLNEHFTAMTEIVFEHQGTLDKYIGDELMAVFGAPLAGGEDEMGAVNAALAIQAKNAELNAARLQEGRATLELGIGINTGEVIAGYMGSPRRMEFTVVGDNVNTAKRFCDMASGEKVVIGESTFEAIRAKVRCRPIGTLMLKGKDKPVNAFEVQGLL